MLIQSYTFSSSFDVLRSRVLAWVKNGRDDKFGRYPPYITIETTTRPAPTTNCKDAERPKINMDMKHVMTTARECANPLKILSAYFTTTATIRPYVAWRATIYNTNRSYPKKKPLSWIS